MPIIISIALVPIILIIISELNRIHTKKKRRLLNAFLLGISFIYIVLCFQLNMEPFQFDIDNPGEYILYSGVILIFSPFLWVVLYYYSRQLFRKLRVYKNSKLKSFEQYEYYRDDLNKISPGVLMFTSKFDIDAKSCITATILKLKLAGYIEENKIKPQNDNNNLLKSEQMVIDYMRTKQIDEKAYKKLIEKETLKCKYIKNNAYQKIFKILKMIATCFIPVILIFFSIHFDQYVFDNYHIWPDKEDNIKYLKIVNKKEIEHLYNHEIKDMNDYKHYIMYNGEISYSYNYIRADKLKYSVVRKAILLNILNNLIIMLSVTSIFVALYMVIEQIRFFNKNYRRTIQGNQILSKAYALKNYLKDFSIIKNRKEEEIVLWEYYLIYAVILDVNVQLPDEIIQKYIEKNM